MRGLAMLLVVVGHVFIFGIHDESNTITRILCNELEIPLFFMVSGMLFKVPVQGVTAMIGRKAFQLCVPAAIFMVAYSWMRHDSIMASCFDVWKNGYWFTFSLFEFTLICAALRIALRRFRLSAGKSDAAMFLLSGVIMFCGVWADRQQGNFAWISLLGLQHLKSFPYFVLGTVIAGCGWMSGAVKAGEVKLGGVFVALFMVMHLYSYRDAELATLGFSSTLWIMVMTMTGLMAILPGFRRYPEWSDGCVGRMLQTIGRHSLDVYFIHYFFLPRNMGMVGEWFTEHPNALVEFALCLIIAGIVVAASLLSGRIIRLNPVTAHWLLGANGYRNNPKSTEESNSSSNNKQDTI